MEEQTKTLKKLFLMLKQLTFLQVLYESLNFYKTYFKFHFSLKLFAKIIPFVFISDNFY